LQVRSCRLHEIDKVVGATGMERLSSVKIQSADRPAYLLLSQPAPEHGNNDLASFVATINDKGLQASSRIYAYGARHITDLFDDVAKNWKGWAGEKVRGSIEGDLCFSCTSDGLGHTFVKIELSSGPYDLDWQAETTLQLDAAQLDHIASQLRQFFGLTNDIK